MRTNVIINGDFSSGSQNNPTGWSGTDIETRSENVYVRGGDRTNTVAELDGNRNQITVMEQTFTLDNTRVGEVRVDNLLRSGSNANVDGFRVEVLDSNGTVLAAQDVFPTSNATYDTTTLPVTFPSAGDYTLRSSQVIRRCGHSTFDTLNDPCRMSQGTGL